VLRLRTDAERWAAKQARAAWWDRPLDSRWRRLVAWLDLLVRDHGVLRLVYLNRHRVTPELWRSAQPAPHDLAAAARGGIRAVVNLRGGRELGAWPLQKEACERLGLSLHELLLRSRGLPERELLLGLPAFFEALPKPVLAHCKSGADRAGLFAALYLIVHEKRSAAEALGQLSPRYGHFRMAKTGVLDAFIEAYAREGEANGLSFVDWARDVYDPARIEAGFRAGFWSSLVADRLLRRE
jgi:uncharacterized protein (TIGR01244 family)